MMKRDVILFNWRNTSDVSTASSYSKLLKEVLEGHGHIVKEIYLRTTKTKDDTVIESHGPFDVSQENAKSMSMSKIDKRFAGFCRERFNIFVNSILIITDVQMLKHINTFMFKECKIIFVASSDHILLNNEDLSDEVQSNIFFKENVDATMTGNRDDYNLHRLVFDGKHTNNFFAPTSYLNLGKPRNFKDKDIVLFHGHWELDFNLKKLDAFMASINKKAVFYADGSKFEKYAKKGRKFINLEFVTVDNDIQPYLDRAMFFSSVETYNVSQPFIEAMANGIPLMLFNKTGYNKKFLGEFMERGLFINLDLGYTIKQLKMFENADDYFAMSERCIDYVQRKFDRKSFEDNINIMIRRLK